MANAARDQNRVPTLTGALESNGTTIVPIKADQSTRTLTVDDGTTGTDRGPANAPRDENRVPVLLAVSEVDGTTPVVIYATANGALLVDSS